jgi:hypothetical protein
LRARNYFDNRGFVNTLSAVASGDGNSKVVFTNDKGSNFLLGTLSATDIYTADRQEDLRASNCFDKKGFINTPSAVTSGDDDMPTTSSCEGTLGSDEAPTDIQINDTVFINGYIVFTNDKDANFLLGTLSATDIDTADNELTFTITTTSTSFKIVNNNELSLPEMLYRMDLSVGP